MIINVTAKHIKNGRHSCFNCPVALAIKDVLNVDAGVSVTAENIEIFFKHLKIRTPIKAATQIRIFDNMEQMRPFTFELDIDEKLFQ